MDKKSIIQKEAETLLNQFGFHAATEVSEKEGIYTVTFKTDDEASILIGKFGETLNAIQRVLEAILYNQCKEKVELVVNVNDYREKQVERLQGIAENIASRVKEEKDAVTLRSFSPYERKIIHGYISRVHPDLTSYSEGEGDERTLVVMAKKEE